MSNVTGTYPIQTVVTDGGGDATITYITTPAGDNDNPPAVTSTVVIAAAQLNGNTPTANDSIQTLDDGNFQIVTPEMTAEAPAPVTFPTFADAEAAITAPITGIVAASGVVIPVPVVPTSPLPAGLLVSDLTAVWTLQIAA